MFFKITQNCGAIAKAPAIMWHRHPGRVLLIHGLEPVPRLTHHGACSSKIKLLRLHQLPIDSNNAFVCEALQRFGEGQIGGTLAFFESDETEVCPTFALQDRHYSIVFVEALKMAISGWFLPQSVNFRFTRFVYDFGKTRCFSFEKLHK